ncbi:MAG: type I-D CRISPR-associated protein Cas10d/Csc3 [bacterium]
MEMMEVLNEYVEKVIPKMIDAGYSLKLAKGGAGYEHLPEQSLFSHIVNGVFGFSRLWGFLDEHKIFSDEKRYNEKMYRKFLSLYTTHDMHKTEDEKLGASEFSVNQDAIEREIRTLGLDGFAETNWHDHRAAMTHDRSVKQGDRLLGSEGIDQLVEMVRVADTMASIETPREIVSLQNHLKDLSKVLATNYRLYFHELADIRGVLTNQIHDAVAEILRGYDFFPLLFFASGVIYLGPKALKNLERRAFIPGVVEKILGRLTPSSESSVEPEGAYRNTSYDFESYIYSVTPLQRLLDFALDKAMHSKEAGFYESEMQKWFGKVRKKEVPFDTRAEFEGSLNISVDPQDKYFYELLHGVSVYLFIVDSIIRDAKSLQPDQRAEWLADALSISDEVSRKLSPLAASFTNAYGGGKVPKYAVPFAYHFLKGPDFAKRSATSTDRGEVLNKLHDKIRAKFKTIDDSAVAKSSMRELHIEDDLEQYLRENLFVSIFQETELMDDPFSTYAKQKGKSHSRICSLCGRDSEFNMPIRTGVLGDSAQEFSNRILPQKTIQQCRRWCPTCYLEFTFRSIGGLTSPPNIDRGKSMLLYFYILPTYSFTPEQVRMLSEDVFYPFKEVTSVVIRDYGGEKPSHAHVWLEGRKLDREMLENWLEVFRSQSEWIREHLRRNGRDLPGERLFTARSGQLNYKLLRWERTAYGATRDDAQIPTHSEMGPRRPSRPA